MISAAPFTKHSVTPINWALNSPIIEHMVQQWAAQTVDTRLSSTTSRVQFRACQLERASAIKIYLHCCCTMSVDLFTVVIMAYNAV